MVCCRPVGQSKSSGEVQSPCERALPKGLDRGGREQIGFITTNKPPATSGLPILPASWLTFSFHLKIQLLKPSSHKPRVFRECPGQHLHRCLGRGRVGGRERSSRGKRCRRGALTFVPQILALIFFFHGIVDESQFFTPP